MKQNMVKKLIMLTPKPWHIYTASAVMVLAFIIASGNSCTPAGAASYTFLAISFFMAYASWKGFFDEVQLNVPRRFLYVELLFGLLWGLLMLEYGQYALAPQTHMPDAAREIASVIIFFPRHLASVLMTLILLFGIQAGVAAIVLTTPVAAMLTAITAGHLLYAASRHYRGVREKRRTAA